ncbi:hypothetical protein KSS87_005314 [Heliosperma pusillum]|nr:hypothetical protein KSS87_005314 [Heliosperma pusillum]
MMSYSPNSLSIGLLKRLNIKSSMNHFTQKRYELVNGVVAVEGVASEATQEQGKEKASEKKDVPNLWLTAMQTTEILSKEVIATPI